MPESSSTPTSTTGLQRLSRSQPHEVSVHCDRVSGHGCPHGPVGVKLLSSLVGGVLTRLVVLHSTPSRSLQQPRIFSGTMADISSFAVEPTRSARYPPHRCLPRLVKAARLQFVNHLLFGAMILACTPAHRLWISRLRNVPQAGRFRPTFTTNHRAINLPSTCFSTIRHKGTGSVAFDSSAPFDPLVEALQGLLGRPNTLLLAQNFNPARGRLEIRKPNTGPPSLARRSLLAARPQSGRPAPTHAGHSDSPPLSWPSSTRNICASTRRSHLTGKANGPYVPRYLTARPFIGAVLRSVYIRHPLTTQRSSSQAPLQSTSLHRCLL